MSFCDEARRFIIGLRAGWPRVEFWLSFCDAAAQIGLDTFVFYVSRSYSETHILGRTPINEWSVCRRDRYLYNTQQAQETSFHSLSGIRTRDPSNHPAVDIHHIRPGHWDWMLILWSWPLTCTWDWCPELWKLSCAVPYDIVVGCLDVRWCTGFNGVLCDCKKYSPLRDGNSCGCI